MLFSPNASILTIKGWEPIKSHPIVLDLIGLDLKRGYITEIPSVDIDADIVKKNQVLRLSHEYIYTTTDSDSMEQCEKILLAWTKVKPFPELEDLTMDEIYLLGIILTDSYFAKSGEIEIYQSMKKGHVVEKIDSVLTSLGIKGSLYERQREGTHFTWRIKKDSAAIIKDRFNLQDRGNPSMNLLFMNGNQRMQLLGALMDGDGTWNNPQKTYGVFYKPQIIDFMQLLAMTLGYKTKTNTHRKQIYMSQVGLFAHGNWIEPEMGLIKQKSEFVEIVSKNGVLFSPIILETGKVYFGKI